MRALAAKLKKFEADEVAVLKSIRRHFPEGCFVTWKHGEHERTGKVICFSGFHLNTAQFKVASITGRQYWVPAWSVLETYISDR